MEFHRLWKAVIGSEAPPMSFGLESMINNGDNDIDELAIDTNRTTRDTADLANA